MTVALRTRLDRGRRRGASLWWGTGVLSAVVLLCVLAPLLSPHGPNEIVAVPFSAPSAEYPFGTDALGRDVFVRVWVGGRLDLVIAAIVVGVSLAVGTVVGIVSGATPRRWLDALLMRFVDALVAFPFVILVLALIVVVGRTRSFWFLPPGAPAIVIASLLVNWSIYARLARAETMSLRGSDHVAAGRMLGYPQSRIVGRHLLPGVVRITASYAVADVVIVVIATASLAFLGTGVQAPTAEWGSIMYEGRAVLGTSWWITTFPGLVLAVTGLAVTLIADALLKVER
ncbi:MAG: ABC transporter permease [Thermoleophilia bacterium]|nr:ABC transporter permease [Thermoleophilia bacterium]